jgi:hypothetical protein
LWRRDFETTRCGKAEDDENLEEDEFSVKMADLLRNFALPRGFLRENPGAKTK